MRGPHAVPERGLATFGALFSMSLVNALGARWSARSLTRGPRSFLGCPPRLQAPPRRWKGRLQGGAARRDAFPVLGRRSRCLMGCLPATAGAIIIMTKPAMSSRGPRTKMQCPTA